MKKALLAGVFLAAGAGVSFAETRVTRVFLPERLVRGNTGIASVQEIDAASWVWHPTVNGDLERGKRVSEFVGRKQVIYRF